MLPINRLSYSSARAKRLAALAARARLPIDGQLACAYCGAVANTIDHVPPRRARAQLIGLGLEATVEFAEFPACRECNCTLGDKDLWSFEARQRYVRRRLRLRYTHELQIPDWSDGELASLSPQMRGYVIDGLAVRDYLRARLTWAGPR